jgi:hypothetical protein
MGRLLEKIHQQERCEDANRFIECVARNGRKFFFHKGEISRLELDKNGRVWFVDSYSKKRVYTHYRYDWRGFSEGGTLQRLIKNLRDFIKTGKKLPEQSLFFPKWACEGDVWGYGADMETVQNYAKRKGIVD